MWPVPNLSGGSRYQDSVHSGTPGKDQSRRVGEYTDRRQEDREKADTDGEGALHMIKG